MDLERTLLLNKWWQEAFDKKHPAVARRRRQRDAGIGDVCPKCRLRIDSITHSYSDLGGFECLQSGARKTVKKSPSMNYRKRISST